MEQNNQNIPNNGNPQGPAGQRLYYIVPQGQMPNQAAAQQQDIDYKKYVQMLVAKWKWIFKVCCVVVVVAFVIAISLPKRFTSEAVLAPEVAQKSGSSGLSGLASLAGINLSAGSSSEAMYPELYPQIISSAPFVVDLFDVPVSFEREDETIETDLYTYLKEYGKAPWWSSIISAPKKALSWVIGLFKSEEEIEVGLAEIEATHLNKEQFGIYTALTRLIQASVDKKTMIINISVTLSDAEVAKYICDVVVDRLTNTVVEYRTEKARHDLEYYQKLEGEAKSNYYEVQQKYAAYVDANHGVTRQSVMLEQQRLQNESSLAFTLYNQMAQQRQAAEAKLQMETPVCMVVQPASVPLKGEPSRAKVLIIICFLGFVAACAWVLFGKQGIDMAKEIIFDSKMNFD